MAVFVLKMSKVDQQRAEHEIHGIFASSAVVGYPSRFQASVGSAIFRWDISRISRDIYITDRNS